MGWRDRFEGVPRWARCVVPAFLVLALALLVVLPSGGDDQTNLTASVESSTTTHLTTTTTGPTTSTESTTTVEPTTTAQPTTTAPPPPPPVATAPPPPPSTVPAGPTEFQATVRGHDQGPDYHGIFYGTTFGGGGGFSVAAKCRPGTVTVTVLEDGWVAPQPDNVSYPTRIWVYADGNELAYNKSVTDGTVVSGAVASQVAIRTSGPSEQAMRIKYSCQG